MLMGFPCVFICSLLTDLRLKEHVEDPDKLPILIFPEGTCINNTSVMQFKKGSFEVGGKIYPGTSSSNIQLCLQYLIF